MRVNTLFNGRVKLTTEANLCQFMMSFLCAALLANESCGIGAVAESEKACALPANASAEDVCL